MVSERSVSRAGGTAHTTRKSRAPHTHVHFLRIEEEKKTCEKDESDWRRRKNT